jgi:hypothetical protein
MKPDKPLPAVRCTRCGLPGIPPQYSCRQCGQSEFDAVELPGRGTVYTHTTIRVAPEAYRDQAPYPIAIVDLTPGLRLTARIIPSPEKTLAIGQELVFERVDANGYWFKAAS